MAFNKLNHLPSKPLSRLQTYLIELKASIALLSEVLTEVKKVSEVIEGLLLGWERVLVGLVALVLTIIGALTLLSWKIDLPHLIKELSSLFQ